MKRTVLVVPCYNEARRLDLSRVEDCMTQQSGIDFLFVNDGSSDSTLEILSGFAAKHPERVAVRDQQPNQGKAEAVRGGVLQAFDQAPAFIGYWDADFAAPLDEVPRFLEIFDALPERQIVIGSRVKLLGRNIERAVFRHYLGRVAATVTSLTLRMAVYDTQCGAKLFRANPQTRALFAEPFITNWVFDVEIMARLIRDMRRDAGPAAESVIYELPLNQWHDVAGSKIKGGDYLTALIETARIHRRYLRRTAIPERP